MSEIDLTSLLNALPGLKNAAFTITQKDAIAHWVRKEVYRVSKETRPYLEMEFKYGSVDWKGRIFPGIRKESFQNIKDELSKKSKVIDLRPVETKDIFTKKGRLTISPEKKLLHSLKKKKIAQAVLKCPGKKYSIKITIAAELPNNLPKDFKWENEPTIDPARHKKRFAFAVSDLKENSFKLENISIDLSEIECRKKETYEVELELGRTLLDEIFNEENSEASFTV